MKSSTLKVLVACEESGVVRDAFIKKGHDAMSCDILPTSSLGPHYRGDVRDILEHGWDLMIGHPPCTYLTNAGARWIYDDRYPDRRQKQEEAFEFFMQLWDAPIKSIALENPIGAVSRLFRKPDQIIKPLMFGQGSTKQTCLWLKNLPKLTATDIVEPEYHVSKSGRKWDKWFFESSLISDLEERSKFRSKTFKGVADAMAQQWG